MFAFVFFFGTLLCLSIKFSGATDFGVNYGKLGNNLPSAYQSIQLVREMGTRHVKLFDADPEILKLLSETGLYVTIMVNNSDIVSVGSSQTSADAWVRQNVLPYYPTTIIRFLLVGNEVLSHDSVEDREMWHHLVPAMYSLQNSLLSQGIGEIKIGTPLAMDVLETTFPPSRSSFRDDIKNLVISPLLKFLNTSDSFFFINSYTYFPWSKSPDDTTLDFALLQGNRSYKDPGSGLIYKNLLDQMLDAVVAAMAKLDYPNIPVAISETGWPNGGDNINCGGANIANAATYNRNLIRKMSLKPPLGTPARPGTGIPTFIFSLFDENLKQGPGTEKHWGLVYPNGTRIYDLDFRGAGE